MRGVAVDVAMSPEVWVAGFVAGFVAGVPVAFGLFLVTRPIVDAVLALARHGRS